MMKKWINWVICLGWSLAISAQDFTYEAKIEAVTASGFHKIVLSAELLGKANVNLSDLRMYNEAGMEQPYLIQQESSVSTNAWFKEYEIIKRQGKKDTTSYLLFKNDDARPIDNVCFIVQNTAVSKRARLSGSKDGENWYVIRNNYLLQAMHSANKTTELKMLDFPLSDFAYFKLEIDDNLKEPINIMKVGYYESQKMLGLSSSFDFPVTSQTDSAGTSFITLNLPEVRYLEKLRFDMSGADYYSRYARILIKVESENKRKEKVYHFQEIGSFELNSKTDNEIVLGGMRVQELYLEIENGDNRPLKVTNGTGSFLNRYAVADLKEGQAYLLKFGNETLRTPNYDIAYFSDLIPADAQKLAITKVSNLSSSDTIKKTPSIFENRYVIWAVIGLVGLVLGFISYRMIKELGSRKE